jgi:hypothetical protein
VTPNNLFSENENPNITIYYKLGYKCTQKL